MMEYIGKEFLTQVRTTKEEDGRWLTSEVIVQRRTSDGENWESKDIMSRTVSDSPEEGIQVVLNSILEYMRKVDYDLFTEPPKDGSALSKSMLN